MGRQSNPRPSNSSRQDSRHPSADAEFGGMALSAGDASRIVVLHGEVNETSVSVVVANLLHMASVDLSPIYLVISTYGGSVDEMFTLYDTIKFLPCPVHTIALGKVMSAGVLLLASGTKGKRMIGKSARIMIHPVSGGATGNVFQVVAEADEHVRLQDQMADAIANETKMTRQKVRKIMSTGHDVYITPDDAVKYGIVDKIIGASVRDFMKSSELV